MAAVAKKGEATETTGKKWHAQYPALATGSVPIEPYISPEYFQLVDSIYPF